MSLAKNDRVQFGYLRQTVCMVINPIMVEMIASLFYFTTRVGPQTKIWRPPHSVSDDVDPDYQCLWPSPSWYWLWFSHVLASYYENMPFQIYRKFYHQKMKIFR